MVKIASIKANPNNPRIIKDERFKKLVTSLKEFPKMMKLRPIIVDNDNMILGGNMRYRALQELGFKELPDEWVKRAEDLTEDEKRRFIVSDNLGYGEWDYDILANEWDQDELTDWGMELPPDWGESGGEQKDLSDELKETYEVIISCSGEEQQEKVYNKLISEGYECRVLTL